MTDEANAHIDEKAVIAVKSEITAAAKTADTALLGSLSTLKGYSGNPACKIAIQCGLLAIAAPIKNFDAELRALESVDVGETIGIFIFRMEELILIPFWQTAYSVMILLFIPYALIILIMAISCLYLQGKKRCITPSDCIAGSTRSSLNLPPAQPGR